LPGLVQGPPETRQDREPPYVVGRVEVGGTGQQRGRGPDVAARDSLLTCRGEPRSCLLGELSADSPAGPSSTR
jgi:hypothetical protein